MTHCVAAERWDIFCRVVDNFGDIGVCWRLARSLAHEHGFRVRLWVDDPAAFGRLCPQAMECDPPWRIDAVEVHPWIELFPDVVPARVVIEAFACDPPEAYVEAMARCDPRPLWINLEYLSAEAWVAGCHLLASPHPRLPLVKRFFLPGFSAQTGGLLRERGLLSERDRYRREEGARGRFLAQLGLGTMPADTLLVSLFAYGQADLPELMERWSRESGPVLLLVPEGRIVTDVARYFGRSTLSAGSRIEREGLTVMVRPFTDQAGYDRLLWSCDVNFVRGEDSFVRAQWAARPFVWQIYAQELDAHRVKLEAFMDGYCDALDPDAASALRRFWRAWNGEESPAAAWPAFAAALPVLDRHASNWCERIAQSEELASVLARFAQQEVK